MKKEVYFGIAIRIIILFSVAILMTYVPEHLHGFFGDTIDPTDVRGRPGFIHDGWDWGSRHYWFWWMMCLLFILSLINVIAGSISLLIKHYPELDEN